MSENPKPKKRLAVAEKQLPQSLPEPNAEKESRWLFSGLLEPGKAQAVSLYADIFLRLIVGAAFLWITHSWLNSVIAVLEKQSGIEKPLSDAVLIAMLTTTTINVLGLALAMALYLFPKRKVQETLEKALQASAVGSPG
ncbi:MAG: hypothetical protein ACRC8S_17850 [Fimbriiglobus sp.]